MLVSRLGLLRRIVPDARTRQLYDKKFTCVKAPYFDGRIFIFSVSSSLKHLSINTMIIHQLNVFAWLLSIKTMVTLRRLSV